MVVELTPTRAVNEYRFTGGVRQRSTKLAETKRIVADKASGTLAV
jgi:alkaline phosphatase D